MAEIGSSTLRQKELLLVETQHRINNSLQIIANIVLLKARVVRSKELRRRLHDADRYGEAFELETMTGLARNIEGEERWKGLTAPVGCAWCGEPFPPSRRGGHTKLFCSLDCRTAFHTAARQWAERLFPEGQITAADLNDVSRVVHAKRLAPDSRRLSTYPPSQDSPAGFLAASKGISVLWATPEGL